MHKYKDTMKQADSPKYSSDQKGMASILITMVTMVVVSLIVISFAVISRRAQMNTLNEQLSTQAFYAAETGVNDVIQLAKDQMASGQTLPAKTTCSNTIYPYSSLNSVVNSANNVSYSCVLVDTAPKVLSYGDIGTDSTVIPLKSVGGNFSTLTLEWISKDGGSTPLQDCYTGAGKVPLTTVTNWKCGYGVFRFDLVPTPGQTSAQTLQNNDMVRFMVPATSGGSANISYASSPTSIASYKASCSNTSCHLTVHGLTGSSYYMRVMSLYQDSGLKVSAQDNSGKPLGLESAQILIDSTGKAQDVLRRIQVNVSVAKTGQQYFPDNGLQSAGSICKRFSVADGYFLNDAGNQVKGSDRLCGTQSVATPFPPIDNNPGGNGDGEIGSNPNPGPPSKDPKPAGPRWGVSLYVTKAPTETVSRCVWSWGDGTTTVNTGQACQPGPQSHVYHDYPHILTCHTYTVYTIFYGNGERSNQRVEHVPWGTDFNC